MPSFELYQRLHSSPSTIGDLRRKNADVIMNATWDGDIQSKVGYLYDWYHDDEPTTLINLHPKKSKNKIPISFKYVVHTTQTYSKDQTTIHMELRPGQECNVDYYNKFFAKRYGATFPIGLYLDVPDRNGVYNRWLVVGKAEYYSVQFQSFEILPCDELVQYMFNGEKYQVPGCARSQNSYNSGIWTDYKITTVQNQTKFAVPLNRDTEHIFYNMRIIHDANVLTEPVAWHVTKVERTASLGIVVVTLAQDLFNEHADYIETDEDGNVIGKWADYYEQAPQDENVVTLSCSGASPTIKVGGSYKTITTDTVKDGMAWRFTVDGEDASSLLKTSLSDGKAKVKFIGSEDYIGSLLKIEYGNLASINLQIVGL